VQVKTKAIVLSSLKFQEKSLIVKCFTLSHGLKSYFVRDAGRKSNQNCLFPTLNHSRNRSRSQNKGTLEISKINFGFSFHSFRYLQSTMMVMFIPRNAASFHSWRGRKTNHFYILETALHWLDNHDEIANFHLILLLETTKYLGFTPIWCRYAFFEMIEGFYTFSCR
jgi:DNA repair protein RecO (recombination protein O)